MISVSEAKQLIFSQIIPLEPVILNLEAASGHVLAKDIYAAYDIPAFKQSSMDGYAVIFDDRNLELELVGEMAAGTNYSLTIKNGETSRIFTGAPLPEGADTVVMQEKIAFVADKVSIHDEHLIHGSNVREKGSEIKAGALAVQKGTLLGPAAIGFLAGIGITEAEVFPMPKVAVILTGKELQKPGKELGFGQVYESNSYSLSAALKQEGINQISVLTADDDLEILSGILESALKNNDVVLLTGGVSVGDYDFVIEACGRCAVEQIFHKVKQKPGKPLYFGKKDTKLVFGLPGNPSSVLSCFYNYVLPALKLLSHKENKVKEVKAELSLNYKKPAGLTHFLKGKYEDGTATPLTAQESYRLSSFSQANCLICMNEEQENFTAGEIITVLLLPD